MTSSIDPGPTTYAPSDVVVALTTLPPEADATAFAEALVAEGLAACVGVGAPMMSVYTWRGAIEKAEERQLIIKTVRLKVPRLKARLASLHPYEIPELLVLPVVDGGEAYLAWVREAAAG